MVLFWHITRRYVAAFVAVLGLLCAFVTTLKLVEASRSIMHNEAPWTIGCVLALCIALDFCHRLFFVALVLAAVLCSNRMARSGELVGLWAQGCAPMQVARPFFVVAVALTAAVLLSSDRLLPRMMARRTALLQQHLGKVEPATLYFQKRSPWYFEGDTIVHLPQVSDDGRSFAHPRVYQLQKDQVQRIIRADSLDHTLATGWALHGATCFSLTEPDTCARALWPLPLHIAPHDLAAHMGNPKEMSQRKARALIARRRSSGLDTTVHRMEVLERTAQPLSGPVLIAAMLPALLRQSRRQALAVALSYGVALICGVLVTGQMLRLLSLAQHLPVAVGAMGQVWAAALLLLGQMFYARGQIIFSGRTRRSNVSAST